MEINTAKGNQQNAHAKVQGQPAPGKAPGAGFLDTFRKLPDGRFRKTGSGLMVATTKEGHGKAAANGTKVRVMYSGWLEDGTKFDSSVDRGKPFEFNLGAGRVIKGWDEGMLGIKPGERRQLVIPAALAYGNREVGKIPPGSTLIFNVEAVAVDDPSANPKGSMTVVA